MAYVPNNANGQATMANSSPVVVASDQSAIPVSDNGGSITVDGSVSISGTAAVSAASLPLPSGAATSAKQPALGTAGSASSDVITVQGIASMTALKVDGSAVTQPISGTVTANAGTGTFAVSASTLPLPSGAATSAKQPALGTAGTPSSDVLTVQGAASMTALKVDGSAVTQPVSAASLPLPSGAATSAKQDTGNTSLSNIDTKLGGTLKSKVSDGTNDAGIVSLTNNKGLAVVVLDGSGNQVTSFSGGGGSGGTQYVEDDPAAANPTGTMGMAVRQDTLSASTVSADGDNIALRATSKAELYVKHSDSIAATQSGTWNITNVSGTVSLPTGAATAAKQPALGTAGTASSDVITVQGIASMTALKVDGSAVTQPVSGTVTANAGTGTFSVSAASLPLPSGAATETTLSALNTKVPSNLTVTSTRLLVDGSGVTQPVSGSISVSSALPAGTNAIGSVVPLPSATLGTTAPKASTALGDVLLVQSGATKLITVTGYSSHTSSLFIQVWNQTSTTVFSGTPICTFVVPPTSNFSLDFGLYGLYLGTGCVLANSSAATSRTAVASTCFFTATYV